MRSINFSYSIFIHEIYTYNLHLQLLNIYYNIYYVLICKLKNVNTPKTGHFSELDSWEQRIEIQNINPDMLAWVFSLQMEWKTDGWYSLLNMENVLACYPNQIEDGQIVLPEGFEDGNIVIINMGALRKWKIEVIMGDEKNIPEHMEIPVLLSPWVIEYWEDEKSGKKYTQTVLRDWGQMNSSTWITSLADANERTTTAWRNFSWELIEDLEVENAEESPFLMQDKEGDYFLVTHDLEYKDFLVNSIRNFLENKYLRDWDENYEEVKKAFEAKFKEVNYDDLENILNGIIESESFEEYEWRDGEIEWLEKDKIQLWWEKWDFYVYHDEANNTIEYRAVREITWFPEWLKTVWRIPLRLFLESQNQDPQFRNIKNIWVRWTKLVPTMSNVSRKVRETL